jgi:protein-disulfide isomerase
MKKIWIALPVVAIGVAVAACYYTAANSDSTHTASQTLPTAAAEPSQPAVPQAPPQNQLNAGFPYTDTSMLKPPAGAKVAIYEFEDLECPACAHAAPIVHAAVAQYHVPLVRRDYPWPFHTWSFDAAITARYLQDSVSPALADEFRRDVFANQSIISSKDDLAAFTRRWFQAHGRAMPFVMDASGACRVEVESDRALGDRLGVHATPCIFVVTQTSWVPIANVAQLDQTIEAALKRTAASAI